ncbi:MAG: prephenate dehydrogenase [Tissierellaceae bacterium]
MIKIHKIAIIGLGLMGGSLALGLKNKGYEGIISGYDISTDNINKALRSKAIDTGATDAKEAVRDADLVVLGCPIGEYEKVFMEISGQLKPKSIVTDLGSVKSGPVALAKKIFPKDISFVGGHPMTGSEKGGFSAADPFLYENAYYFITHEEDSSEDAIRVVEDMVGSLGAFCLRISPGEHDMIVSRISHLPHVIAMSLVNFLGQNDNSSYLPFVGGGFKDTTRIASGSPHMWKEILMSNRIEIIDSLVSFQELIGSIIGHLQKGEAKDIEGYLKDAKKIRDSMPYGKPDYIRPLYEIAVSIEDKPGAIAELANIMMKQNINIKEIEILHSRQSEGGAVRLAFDSREEQKLAVKTLGQEGFSKLYFS